jgi:hypothetical protein
MDGLTDSGAVSTVIGPAVLSQVNESVFYVTFSSGSSAGTVVVEGAPYDDYSGTWSNLATVNFAAASRTHRVIATGVHLALRLRITSAITSGTVTGDYAGN